MKKLFSIFSVMLLVSSFLSLYSCDSSKDDIPSNPLVGTVWMGDNPIHGIFDGTKGQWTLVYEFKTENTFTQYDKRKSDGMKTDIQENLPYKYIAPDKVIIHGEERTIENGVKLKVGGYTLYKQ